MPRRAAAQRREVVPDPRVQQPARDAAHQQGPARRQEVDRRAHRLRRFDIVEKRSGNDPLATFKKAMDNVRPTLEVKPKRVGGATYQVPVEVRLAPVDHAGDPLDRRLLPQASREDDGRAPRQRDPRRVQRHRRLGQEAREDLFKMAESNRAFAHYRW